jgi:ferredoxin
MVYVDGERCQGCGVCMDACPTGAIRLVDGVAAIEQSLCNECQACVDACPNGAILAVSKPVSEGEGALQRVPATPPATPAGPTLPATREIPARAAWLGTALAFVGREVAPRVVNALLEAWERRTSPSSPSASSQSAIGPTGTSIPSTVTRGGGRRWRLRRRSKR